MMNCEDLVAQAQSWVDRKINKLKELKDRQPLSDIAKPEAIERLFINKKRSIFPIPEASIAGLRKEIKLSIEESRPIRLITPFGCYKPVTLPSPTTANWAEFIHFSYMAELAAEIASIHSPGVELVYKLGDIDMDLLADVTDKEVYWYFQTFSKLANRFRDWVPANVSFQVSKLSDYISKENFRQATEVEIDRLRPIWEKDRDSSRITTVCDRTKRNNTNVFLSDGDVFEKALRSAAMIVVDTRYLCEKKAINLIYRTITEVIAQSNLDKTIFPFRSCSGCLVQFWVGEGGLVWNGKKVYPVIFGQNSVREASILHAIDSYEFRECGPNFNQLTIYSKC